MNIHKSNTLALLKGITYVVLFLVALVLLYGVFAQFLIWASTHLRTAGVIIGFGVLVLVGDIVAQKKGWYK